MSITLPFEESRLANLSTPLIELGIAFCRIVSSSLVDTPTFRGDIAKGTESKRESLQ